MLRLRCLWLALIMPRGGLAETAEHLKRLNEFYLREIDRPTGLRLFGVTGLPPK
jgi:hypothetical protein